MSEIQNAELSSKLVGEIKGEFIVKSYQRGYRWGESQVLALLNDIYDNGSNPYCLQPIVVRKQERENVYELIDGQQRLTTLLIILKYIQKEYKPRVNVQYTLSYETREKTAEFLNSITEEEANTNIDFFHIRKAYETIDSWFKTKGAENNKDIEVADDLFGYLNKNVKVIWYEVDQSVDAISLFARLNIGKIALTNAELVKALFLLNTGLTASGSGSSDEIEERKKRNQIEMSIQWDNIEHILRENDDEFWYFLTRTNPIYYPTRIELLFDFMSGKSKDEREPLFTFFFFEKEIKEKGIDEVWLQIQHDFLQLREWFSNMTYYHKIGYLIASESATMPEILKFAKGRRKKDFLDDIDKLIADSIKSEKGYSDLSYGPDSWLISRILLLFNIQSMLVSESKAKFPFSAYNTEEWSLEHIHAQNSQGMKTDANRIKWLEQHVDYVENSKKDFDKEGLVQKMRAAIANGSILQSDFDKIAAEAFVVLSENSDASYIHLLSNMALLSKDMNSTLNNAVFAVKRNKIVEMDRIGSFIPYCTKMVFLKYYTDSSEAQMEFWSAADRAAYTDKMKKAIDPYLALIDKEF